MHPIGSTLYMFHVFIPLFISTSQSPPELIWKHNHTYNISFETRNKHMKKKNHTHNLNNKKT